ncbi:MAG TPA: hypothetical protein DHU96_08670 [Actinobacteria bacterium]|nr:hypothetical protein [Actinomycetota bacterium]
MIAQIRLPVRVPGRNQPAGAVGQQRDYPVHAAGLESAGERGGKFGLTGGTGRRWRFPLR